MCTSALDKFAPQKQKHVRANQQPFVNKTILKAIMNRTRLRNKFLKEKSAINRKSYNKLRNLCVSLVRTAKKEVLQ